MPHAGIANPGRYAVVSNLFFLYVLLPVLPYPLLILIQGALKLYSLLFPRYMVYN